MGLVETIQKQVLFEEAARQGVVNGQLSQIQSIFANILGVTDIGVQQYGGPLTPVYIAQAGDLIDIQRIAGFFTGLARDLNVANQALGSVEDKLLSFNLEMWARMQLVKNRAMNLSKKAQLEKIKVSLGATWAYTESFSTTNFIDMTQTTAWLDTSEGIAFLPNSGPDQNIAPKDLTISNAVLPTGGNFLGSIPVMAFDGLDSTNWRCTFIQNDGTVASCIASFIIPTDLTSITLDPIGFGIDILVEADSGNGWVQVIQDIIYNKSTFPVEVSQVKQLRFSFSSATTVLPRTVGLREIVIYKTQTLQTAEVWSKLFQPSSPFTQVKLQLTDTIPAGATITPYYRLSPFDNWIKIITGDWNSINDTFTTSWILDPTTAVSSIGSNSFRGLNAIPIRTSSDMPLTTSEGLLDVGKDQIEVTAFRKNWAELGDIPHSIVPSDFVNQNTTKAWTSVPILSINNTQSVVQHANQNDISSNPLLTTRGQSLVFQRQLDPNTFDSTLTQYNQMVIVPYVGVVSGNAMQPNYNYKLSYSVYCPKQFYFSNSRYWLYQGYRQSGRRSYKDLGKSYGSFTMYINGILVCGDNQPNTSFTDGTSDNEQGHPFTLTMQAGWNQIDIYMCMIDPSYTQDGFDSQPYFQLSLYPSIFDSNFQNDDSHPITDIVGSKPSKSVSNFDLLWNLPKDFTFWSWSDDRNYLLFNTVDLKPVDGYFLGVPPTCMLVYESISATQVDNLYIKLIIQRDPQSKASPILDQYDLLVR